MPELPEVETIRRDLQGEVVNRKIKSVEVRNGRTVRRHPSAKQFRAQLEGRTITAINRAGTYLLLALDDGATLVVQLGSERPAPPGQERQGGEGPPHPCGDHLHPGRPAALRRPQVPSASSSCPPPPPRASPALPELAHLGFDPLEDIMSWEKFWVLLSSHKSALKALLMDQEFVAGIGNMYADEILFAAGLRYDRQSNSLSSQEVRRLYRSMVETLAEAVKRRGSSTGGRAVPRPLRRGGRLPGPAPGLRPRGSGLPALPLDHRAGEVRWPLDVLLRTLPGLTRVSRGRPAGAGRVSARCS